MQRARSNESAYPQWILGVGHTFSNVSEALRKTSETTSAGHVSQLVTRCPVTRYTDESRCPSFSFLVLRYCDVEAVGGISMGSRSLTERPWPVPPATLFGLLLSMRVVFTPR